MNDQLLEFDRRRRLIGILALLGMISGCVGLYYGSMDSAWAAGALRVGIVLGAIWLALPTRTRSAAWAHLSKWKLVGIIVATLLIKQLKVLLPVLAVGFAVGWFIRPRRKS